VVMGAGRVLTQGTIQELKQIHNRSFEVRLKADPGPLPSSSADSNSLIAAANFILAIV